MAKLLPRGAGLALIAAAACSGAQRPQAPIAGHCEIQHNLRGDDEIDGRVDRVDGGWLVSLRMRVQVGEGAAQALEVRGQGRVTRNGDELRCQVIEGGSTEEGARFDEALCLDEFESVAGLIQDAEQAARPGERVVQEVSLRGSRRRRRRSRRVAPRVVNFRERAEVVRDDNGRVVRLNRSSERGGHEEIHVTYPAGETGHCVRTD